MSDKKEGFNDLFKQLVIVESRHVSFSLVVTFQRVAIDKELFDLFLKAKFIGDFLRSRHHRKEILETEIGQGTYLTSEGFALARKKDFKVLVKKYDGNVCYIVITKQEKIIKNFQEIGFKFEEK